MIQYDTNGVTLFYIDATGQKISRNPLDGDDYDALVVIEQAQKDAVSRNTQVVSNYKTELANAQGNLDAGRPPALIPIMPSEKVVDDLGVTTYRAFNPPLATLVQPTTAPSTSIVTQGTPDKQSQMFNMVRAIYNKMFPGA